MKENLKKYFFLLAVLCFSLESIVIGLESADLESFTEIVCELRPFVRRSHEPTHLEFLLDPIHHPRVPVSQASSSSTNWCGYVAQTSFTSPATKVVTGVTGNWVVPTLSSLPGTTYSSIWVGIDGFSNGTVEQLGTEHDWSGGSQSNYAWFEMYPAGAYEFVGFPVNPGDSMGAKVTYTTDGVFHLSLVNYTRNVHTTVPTSYTKSKTAQRSSAEWVVEAPYYGGILPLANFGTVTMTNCTATIRGVTGPINSHRWAHESIIMKTSGGIVKAMPSALNPKGRRFSVVWKHQ